MIRPRPESLITAAKQLHNSHGLVVGIGVARPTDSERCWTYFPEDNAPFYRMTYLSNYSPNNAPPGHMLLLTETSYSDYKPVPKAQIVDLVVDGLVASGVLKDSDRDLIVATHTLDVDYFYPVPTLGRDAALEDIQSANITNLELPSDQRGFRTTVLRGIGLLDMDLPLLRQAADVDPVELRTLDAIHLAAVLSLGADAGAIFTYDQRLADAARLNHLEVRSPA